MKKLFIKFSMMLFVLGMSTNTVWGSGIMDLAEKMGQGELVEQVQAILAADPVYHAQLTGLASSTGGGVVYATTNSSDPRGSEYEPGISNVAVNGTNLAMRGATDFPVYIFAWAKPAAGYYFMGWSYSDGGTDLVSEKIPNPAYDKENPGDEPEMILPHKEEYLSAYDVATTKDDTLFYTIYATFEPYRFAGYTISDAKTTENQIANLTVVCSILGEDPKGSDFDVLEIVDQTGGTWEAGDTTLNTTEGTLTIPITFTAANTDPGEFTATLKVKTMAGLTLNVPLNARTASSADVEAIRLNKKKVQYEGENGSGTLASMLDKAVTGDIIKLNGNYSGDPATISKDITFDLNGFEFGNTLTVDEGNVTIAYSPYGGTINNNVNVTAGKLTFIGGIITGNVNVSEGATLEQNGASITGTVTNAGTMTTTDGSITGQLTSSGTLIINGGTFTSNSGVAVAVNGGTAQIEKGTIKGNTYGVQSAGNTTIEKLAVISGNTKALNGVSGTLTVNCGKFADPAKLKTGSITFNAGYFRTNSGKATSVEDKTIWRNTSGAEFREGYEFFAGDLEAAQAAGVSVCHIGSTSYSKLEDAFAYANNTTEKVVIIMDNDYTLPEGYYTLPENATLLIPYNNDQGSPTPIVDRINMNEHEYVTPSEFRCLTLATGVNLDVFGTIEVSGRQFSCGDTYTGAAYGPYGHLHLNKGSKIVLQNASLLRAWGFVTSGNSLETSGEIDVRRGGKVYELFQMGDWGSAKAAGSGLLGGSEVFPLNTYFIQNVEAPTKYHPGAKLSSATTVCESGLGLTIMMSADNIQIIGVSRQSPLKSDTAMFLMDDMADAENTWVRKWYNPATDQQVYDINSGAHIGQLVIPLVSSPLFPTMGDYFDPEAEGIAGMIGGALSGVEIPESIVMNSSQYNLPITNNFKLHLLSGTLDFTQNTALLPGSEVEVDKEAILSITKSPYWNSGALYVIDYRDWDTWAEGQYARLVKYSPSFDGEPDTRNVTDIEAIGSAKVNVHGAFDTRAGFVFTSANGGNIFSTVADAGTFIFTTQLTGDYGYDPAYEGDPENYTVNVAQKSGSITCKPVWLKNAAADDYVHAGALAAEDDSYCYMDIDGTGGKWMQLKQRGCFTYERGSDTYYIKPQEYVAVVVNNVVWNEDNGEFTSLSGNDDHTFSDAAGTGRLFILLTDETGNDCQWWEVEAKDNYYHCIHPLNDTYYEWKDNKWQEKKFTITWKDKNWSEDPTEDKILATYTVPYGTQAEWLSTSPTREKTVDYTYSFTGWSPALGKVTSDVTYTATYQQDTIKYTIVFVQDGGVEIERHLLPRDSVPVCENVPTRTGYILQWEPGIEPVVGNQTYTATWLPEPPDTFMVTFKNYDGTEILKYTGTGEHPAVEAGVAPTPPAADPSKPQTNEYTYAFTGWKGPKGFTAKNETLPVATENATYVAQYSENARTYEIKFYDEGESAFIKKENLTYGATPTPPAVTKTNPEEGYTYTYVWKNTTDASKTIETVTADASYKPVFTGTKNKYTVTLQCNLPGKCTFTGAGIHTYGDEVAISATIEDPTTYEFINWQEETTHSFGTQTITGDVLYTVMVKEKNKTPVNLPVGIDETDTIASASNYMNVTITSDGVDHSSQIVNANNITLYGNADFVFKHNIKAGYWYSFAVPWRVDATSGVYLGSSSTPAVLGKDFEIIYYDGSIRAAQGKVDACWVYMKNLSTKKVLEPGRAYMIFIKHGSQSQIVFRKKVQEPILTTTATVNQYNAVNDLDANWNAIANPALYKAYMYAGTDPLGFYYISENDEFDWYHLNEEKLVVGEAVYIQAPTTGTIVANSSKYAAAPRRAKAEQATSFDVQIAAAESAKRADHISVQIDENKEEDKYVIGKDLTKFGVSAKLAQMWINRYDVKLCFNTIAPEGDNTSFPMSIYAPKAGEYTIAIEREVATEDYALYLTYNGEAIWNLSDGAYTANLNKGTDANYGLRISAKAPQTATGMDEAVVDAQGDIRKVLINNQVFIIRGEKVYSIDGQLVK